MGGIVKAEGLGDGEWANHRQAALAAATRKYEILNLNRHQPALMEEMPNATRSTTPTE